MKWIAFIVWICMSLAGCAAGMSSEPNQRSTDSRLVIGKTWQWTSTVTPVERITVPDPARYTILLTADERVQARFDCNRGGGHYTITADKLSFGPMISTRMACPPDSLDAPFMRDLQRVTSFFIQEGSLYLELPYDSGTMQFRSPTDIVELQGTIVKKDLEGGFFAIESDDGRVYDPINLPEHFKKIGLKVKVNAKLRNDVASIHMAGDIIEIIDINAE